MAEIGIKINHEIKFCDMKDLTYCLEFGKPLKELPVVNGKDVFKLNSGLYMVHGVVHVVETEEKETLIMTEQHVKDFISLHRGKRIRLEDDDGTGAISGIWLNTYAIPSGGYKYDIAEITWDMEVTLYHNTHSGIVETTNYLPLYGADRWRRDDGVSGNSWLDYTEPTNTCDCGAVKAGTNHIHWCTTMKTKERHDSYIPS